jgi:hypothetical protein
VTGETQSSSVSGTIHALVIEQAILEFQFDEAVVTPYFRFRSIADQTTTTAAFPRMVKSSGPASGTPASEVTALTATELTTTSVSIAVGRVGIARTVTQTVKEDSTIGRALEIQGLVMDAAKLYGEFFDTASTDLFSTITASVGATGQPLTISDMVSAVGSQRTAKARGPMVISLHDHQLKQLQQAQAATTGTAWSTFYTPNAVGGAFGGYFMGCPIWASALNETSTGDRLGAIWVDGQSAPNYCAFGFVSKRAPSSLTQSDVLLDSQIWASFARTGCGVIANNFATAIRSVNA